MNDDEYGSVLLRPLDVEPAGAPLIDVARAMRDGRRTRRLRPDRVPADKCVWSVKNSMIA
jgi:hypothetical protein